MLPTKPLAINVVADVADFQSNHQTITTTSIRPIRPISHLGQCRCHGEKRCHRRLVFTLIWLKRPPVSSLPDQNPLISQQNRTFHSKSPAVSSFLFLYPGKMKRRRAGVPPSILGVRCSMFDSVFKSRSPAFQGNRTNVQVA